MQNIILKIIFIKKKKNTTDEKQNPLYYEIKIKIYKYIYKSNTSTFT